MIPLLLACRADMDGTGSADPYADCDLTDTSDCDGDGSLGADDCDDHEPEAVPGHEETDADGVDNDCDGRTDEAVVCETGGDFASIQEGIAGTPDGGTLELCPGTYAEPILADGRALTIEGGGAEPGEVVIEATGFDTVVSAMGEGSDLTVRNLAVTSEATIVVLAESAFILEDAEVCSATQVFFYFYPNGEDSAASLLRTRTCAWTALNLSGEGEPSSTMDVAENRFSGGLSVFDDGEGTLNIRNNLIQGNLLVRLWGEGDASLTFHNNTVSEASEAVFQTFRADSEPTWHGNVEVYNNIVTGSGSGDWALTLERFWYAPVDCTDLYPSILGPDIAWGFSGLHARCLAADDYDTREADISELLIAIAEEDPLLTNTWWLGAGSAATDAGLGMDSDGSPADLGAFGGEHGDWWKEVSWLND